MEKPLNIIYLEDSPEDVGLTRIALKRAGIGFSMRVVESEKQFREALENEAPDLVLSDHSLPGFDSLTAFSILKERNSDIPFILLTGTVSEEFAVNSLLAGIDDYILKSNLIRLPSSMERVLSKRNIKKEKETVEALHAQLQQTHRLIEIKNKEITDSINYARRIQNAIIPDASELMQDFHSGFVIYEPRDIVSGDLYWLTRHGNPRDQIPQRTVAAVIDCTGHGVPGAFMSLLVSELLNQALYNKDVHTPGEALDFLNKKLPVSLNRNQQERVTDGCDISICVFDQSQRLLRYAGANRPLWLIRKYGQQFEFFEYRPSKASIGAYSVFNNRFETRDIEMKSGDRFFMFTDGVTDQFGGPKGKKMGRKLLQEMLVASAHLDMPEQKEFLCRQFGIWRGNHEQVDDMLLMGIEVK